MSVLDLLHLLGRLFRPSTEIDMALYHVQIWAGQHDLEVVALEPCRRPPPDVLRQYPAVAPREEARHQYFAIAAIDLDHVRCSGIARSYDRTEMMGHLDRTVHVVWLSYDQLDWRARPPRRTAEWPHPHAQGWYTDPTRAHELRWYSAGAPTDLVKDGAVESRDAPPALGVSTMTG
jgi:hypothetical protein